MGCKKLTYYESQSPLKVVYRKTEPQQKAVQWFLSVDPMEELFYNVSSYKTYKKKNISDYFKEMVPPEKYKELNTLEPDNVQVGEGTGF